jgi:hypothetical protein
MVGTLIMHMHYIELCMNETARTLYLHVVKRPFAASTGINIDESSIGSDTPLAFDRLDFSWRSVGAIKAWMDLFLSLSPAECAGLSFIHMAQLARCLMVLYQLSTFAHPAWDCNLVRNTMDILLVLDGVAERLELASNEAGEQSSEDLFMRLSGMMRKFRTNAATKMGQRNSGIEPMDDLTGTASAESDEATLIQTQTLLQPMGPSYDGFLESIFRDFGGGWPM